ncbi:hypothetical protein [Goodfellowiella coeruleoviolacea]|uniref:Uncharacterized protein n=1 Tax=Goodfellowiella coeruleoviolacea TaxID=334858 RepID=A0AAE3KJ78_9PSEU|nr:hypothetical protein [Goodfellowiella coeruleoviolacea]MCP2164033.1 hypothetical protein [Goodfellowiella coeruleoviolacea]
MARKSGGSSSGGFSSHSQESGGGTPRPHTSGDPGPSGSGRPNTAGLPQGTAGLSMNTDAVISMENKLTELGDRVRTASDNMRISLSPNAFGLLGGAMARSTTDTISRGADSTRSAGDGLSQASQGLGASRKRTRDTDEDNANSFNRIVGGVQDLSLNGGGAKRPRRTDAGSGPKIEVNGLEVGNNYNFRRDFAHELKANGFDDNWGKSKNELVDQFFEKHKGESFDSYDDLIGQMYQDGVLDPKDSGKHMGPTTLGDRPGFTKDTLDEITIDSGEHRRHTISSSSLGKAIEQAGKESDLATLNDWLKRHGQPEVMDTGRPELDKRDAMRSIWEYAHNHTGNLWAGDGQQNTSLGFIRGPLLSSIESVNKMADRPFGEHDQPLPLDKVLDTLPKQKFENYNQSNQQSVQTWNGVKDTLVERLTDASTVGPDGRRVIDPAEAVSLIRDSINHADVDFPQNQNPQNHIPAADNQRYYDGVRQVYGQMPFANSTFFDEGGPLDNFLDLQVPKG